MDRGLPTNLNAEQVAVEEGTLQKQFEEISRKSVDDIKSNISSDPSMNYIVGKQLEVRTFFIIQLFKRF